jgi:ATP-dependent RNA helicase RhlE
MRMSFQHFNLTAPLIKALDELGFVQPTTIQEKAFNVIMSGKDVCGIAQTGTGKTLAYLLPCMRMINYAKDRFPQMLVLVPTRELVQQVVDMAKSLNRYRNLEIIGLYGGVNMKPQAAAVLNGADIVVATPGRLYDLILSGAMRTKNIKKLVIDEMDELLNLGFRPQLRNILDLLPGKRQNLLFSATITEEVEQLMDVYFTAPERIEAAPAGTPLDKIKQLAYEVPNFYTKINLLRLLLQQNADMTKVLVFVSVKRMADEVFENISAAFPEQFGVIHSNKEQNHRSQTVRSFHAGEYRGIIATDIVARGIDVSDVSHVINFDLPDTPEHYIHRIGRTGRADREGNAISFITPSAQPQREAIEALMKLEIPIMPLPEDLLISEELTEDERPKENLKEIKLKLPKREDVGPAFHPKSAKNSKVNVRVSHKDKMMAKYGKKKTRGAKKR